MGLMLEYAGDTHVGNVRRNNEDGYAIEPELHLAIVADGMGGAACGEVASELTISTTVEIVRDSKLAPEELLKEAVRESNRRVRQTSEGRPDCKGMGSTVVIALWREGRMWIANVGDSRAYLWRGGQMRQLSYDQNVANELRSNLKMTEEQISKYPHRNVLTMAIGSASEVMVRICSEELESGDAVLLCSDGLYGPVGDPGLEELLSDSRQLEACIGRMIAKANACGGPDNITAVLLRWRDKSA
ncbi:MAG: serine/threonine-protein phosphatase [Acidimicrobiia bacterium]|nr:serine/threonine-protein phosphatase [Acidimicrobiia bacterium]